MPNSVTILKAEGTLDVLIILKERKGRTYDQLFTLLKAEVLLDVLTTLKARTELSPTFSWF